MKKQNGITLIALVITIIILLILAGISIAMLTGSNGLLTKALKAKEEHLISGYKEELNLIIMEELAERTTGTKTEPMIESLDKKIKEKDWVAKTSKEKQDGETVEYLIVESKEGYEFIIEVDNEKETAKIIETNKTPGQKYTITYDSNGGTGEAKTVEVRSGFSKILEENTFTREDYLFAGWCEKQEPDGTATIYLEGSKYQPTGDVTLYAIWTHNVATITFNNNTGTGTMDSKEVVKGKETILPVNSFSKEDYEFIKWNTKADGTGNDYANSGKITITENITLYAIWKEKVTVKSSIKNQTVFEEKTTIPDEYENTVTIPEGFKIASDSGTDVTQGIVIEDVSAGNETTKGSQFVWIPVGNVKNQNGSKNIELNRYTFASDGKYTKQGTNTIEDYFRELVTSSYGNATAIDIEAFKTSVNTNHGYYMGRYEAGDANATSDRTSSSNQSNPMVCKEDKYVYNNITQIKAATLSRGMYTNKKFTSDLINSYAWDTAIVFIQQFSEDVDYSRQTALQTKIAKTGKATDNRSNKDVRCKIYDMAGNCREWTTETCTNSDGACVGRGGCYNYSGITSYRGNLSTSVSDGGYAFRPLLYL